MGKDWVENEAIESGCQVYQERAVGTVIPNIGQIGIAPGRYTTWNLTPCLGLLSCGKYIPLRLVGLMTIEITFGDAIDAVQAGSSTSYQIQGLFVKCATAKLDGALESSFPASSCKAER